jgi:hypothetical protein
MGTGAFSSVRAERDINVAVAGDSKAYLALDASVSDYAEQTGGTLELQFDGSNSGQNGEGLNANADTAFQNVMRIKNQGTETIRLQLANDEAAAGGIGTIPSDGPMVVSYTDSEYSGGNSGTTPFAASPAPGYWPSSDINSQDIGPGDDLYVHFVFFLNSDVQSLGSGASTDIADVPDDIGFYADDTTSNTSDFS